ncbi:hypothetical protein OnM2_048001 [Erysiphe neolycopersici]|uniref:Uncharacterized protein n=1 Tax=Erysiphe neolycopersici TaxID=212602 RepID=A0A420HTG9_9PEZI|nr:hypothetical protein OnM2_048001 [Erysiphe neolycopersici]
MYLDFLAQGMKTVTHTVQYSINSSKAVHALSKALNWPKFTSFRFYITLIFKWGWMNETCRLVILKYKAVTGFDFLFTSSELELSNAILAARGAVNLALDTDC